MDHQDLTDMCMNFDASYMDLAFCNQDPPLADFFANDSSSNVMETKENSTLEAEWVDEPDQESPRQDSTPLQ